MLDNDADTKKCALFGQGWDSDLPGHFNSVANGGWLNRRARFVEKDKTASGTAVPVEFRDDPITYCGRLKTNLEQCQQGLIPETAWQLDIWFNKEDFCIWSPKSVTQQYMLKIESCFVYVPMAQLNVDILRILNSELNKEPALYHYREMR